MFSCRLLHQNRTEILLYLNNYSQFLVTIHTYTTVYNVDDDSYIYTTVYNVGDDSYIYTTVYNFDDDSYIYNC